MCGYVRETQGSMDGAVMRANKSLGFVLVCLFYLMMSGRRVRFWLGYSCANTQGNNRISYTCSIVIIIPQS